MIFAILSGFLTAIILSLFGQAFKSRISIILALIPFGLFVYFLSLALQLPTGGSYMVQYKWVPQLGINLSFHADGLALLFALMISGVGTLVFVYTSYYLKGHVYLDRFYAYLSMFMSAMLGLVFSDNLITLFIFWELTSISSFFLIGFNNQDSASRKSALTALGITGMGGLFLLAAAIMLGFAGGDYSIAAVLASGLDIHNHALYVPIIIFIMLAAFTKSAQFPFHFWLPGAMKAPTPVSTYLHSATMVKAGIYLLLRMSPILGGHHYWNTPLYIIGGITMLYAAIHCLFRTDLKGILAYSTIAALGIMTFLIGLGTAQATLAVLCFIIVHALYKAALFLITGIIDHQTGTRDVSKLAGLGRIMIPVAVAGVIAAVSNAGIPPSIGFLGKDLIYEAALAFPFVPWLFVGALVITNVLLLYAGFLAGIKPFAGTLPTGLKNIQAPSALLYVPALLLGAGSLIFGIFPQLAEGSIIKPAMISMRYADFGFHLKLWHGFNTVLLLSALTIGAGLGLYFALAPDKQKESFIARFDKLSPKYIIENIAMAFQQLAKRYTKVLQHGYLRKYVFLILVFFILLIGYQVIFKLNFELYFPELLKLTIYEVAIITIMFVAIIFTISTSSRLTAVAAMGVVGFAMCLLFVFYSAPDLAMTQFLIDTLTVILFVLVLYKLPKYLQLSETKTKIRDGLMAMSVGILITLIALAVLDEPDNSQIGDYYAENAYILAKGKNVVNVILVDYRGMDTLVEIIVLSIAAIGVFGLLKLRLGKRDI